MIPKLIYVGNASYMLAVTFGSSMKQVTCDRLNSKFNKILLIKLFDNKAL